MATAPTCLPVWGEEDWALRKALSHGTHTHPSTHMHTGILMATRAQSVSAFSC